MLGALTFAVPGILAALAALPVLYWLLRVTPPQPRRLPFPPLRLFLDLISEKQTPARTPWWLLAIRLAAAALVILAAAGPVWQPEAAGTDPGRGPLVLIVDNGAAAARDWQDRASLLEGKLQEAQRQGRGVALVALAETPGEIRLLTPADALERLRALQPRPYLAERGTHLPSLQALLGAQAASTLFWVSDGIAAESDDGFAKSLATLAGERHSLVLHAAPGLPVLGLAGVVNRTEGLAVTALRPNGGGRDGATLLALDAKGLTIGRAQAQFAPGAASTEATFDLPLELRNAAARIEVEGERSALGVALVDDQGRRRRIGVVSGATADQAQPLIAPTYYVTRALSPYADMREARGSGAEAIARLIEDQVSVLVLADVGAIDRDTAQRLETFLQRGGVVIRFAGSRLAAGADELTPVRLRRGGRSLGGSLSWDAPKTLAPFPETSPFSNLKPPAEVSVTRQILAEPGNDLTDRTWAALADGTPIVTGERRGQGHLVLFHVTADPSWSSLPLSGLFVDMLRELVSLSGRPSAGATGGSEAGTQTIAPRLVLDGFGVPGTPPGSAKPIARNHAARASFDHPAGFYGPAEATLAVNVLRAGETLAALDFSALPAQPLPIRAAEARDLRAPLIAGALTLLVLDTLALFLLGGGLGRLRGTGRKAATAALAGAIAFGALAAAAPFAMAQQTDGPAAKPRLTRAQIEAALATRIAYVLTGDAQVDATSKAGLAGLTRALTLRTAFEPGEPIGIDPARDELSFYPLIYWPVVPGRPLPSEQALRRIDAFMKGGGTVVFDTRDAASITVAGAPSPATLHLRRMLATLAIPELEPLPRDHVVTKAFYLINELPGRYATGRTWIEALPPAPDGEARPARSGDGISPVLITGNDLAAAWAVGPRGEPLHAMVGGGERQREMALRGGINLMMYALTGNYKTDQVHVGPLLERLGN